MVFFYIAAPQLLGSREATLKQIHQVVIRKGIAIGQELTFRVNDFKTANLDTLMFCNDKVLKIQNNTEALIKKIDKQYLDLTQKNSHQWWVKGDRQIPASKYFFKFSWNDLKYQIKQPIPNIVQVFQSKLATIQTLLRNNTNQYNEAKALLGQVTIKQGNYNVKDLNQVIVEPFVRPQLFHYTKFVNTVVCIVPVTFQEQFVRNYWKVSQNVIPNSHSKLKVPQKDGLGIWTVNIFNQKLNDDDQSSEQDQDRDPKIKKEKRKKYSSPVAQFIDKARQTLRITVRQFKFEKGLSSDRKKKRQNLLAKLQAHSTTLGQILKTQFSQAYELYCHAKILRIVIESRMRFGSDKTVMYCIQPEQSKQKTVQNLLVGIFGDKDNQGLYGTKDEIQDGQDFFPFIYVPGITF